MIKICVYSEETITVAEAKVVKLGFCWMHRMGRCAARVAAATAAVAVHHLYYHIGPRPWYVAIGEAAGMAALVLLLGWIWEKTSAPTVKLTDRHQQEDVNEGDGKC